MALTIRHTNTNTISDKFIVTAAGITVAALAAVGIYQIGTTQFEPTTTSTVSSYLPGTITPVETFSPELARVTQNSAAVSTPPTVTATNPAAQSAIGTTPAVQPLQGGVR